MNPQVRWAITKLRPYNKGRFLIIPLMEVKSYLYLKLRSLMVRPLCSVWLDAIVDV